MLTAVTEISKPQLSLLPAVVLSYSLSTSVLLNEIGQVRYQIYLVWTIGAIVLGWVDQRVSASSAQPLGPSL